MSQVDAQDLLRIHRAVEAFEDGWRRGAPGRLEALLDGWDGAVRAELFGQALTIELDYRRRGGEEPKPEGYERRFPDLAGLVRSAFRDQTTVSARPDATSDTIQFGLFEVAAPAPAPQADAERFGKYEVIGRLGGGGQGAAFLALDPDLGRQVVLKRYHAAGDDAAREARALCRVRSPHVAQCHDLMRLGDELFLVMEYIPGRPLSEVLKAGRPKAEDAVRLAEQVTEGLEAVHACGLLHRDVKPSNVVIADDGTARLVDFGLAAHLGSLDLDPLSGSPPYMAPEQARRQRERIDARTDLYGVGGLLYAMLTGHPPHPGDTWQDVLEHARGGEVAPPRSLVRSIPRPLERITMKALAADPAQRPASAAELRRSLSRYRIRRRASPILAGAALLVALLVPAWALWPRAARDGASRPAAEPSPRAAGAGPAPGPSPVARVTRFEIPHYPKLNEGKYDSGRAGLLGKKSFTARVDDDVAVLAQLSEPAYSYLIAFRPDGTDELCDPEDENTPPVRKAQPQYPPPSRTNDRYRLSEGAGLHAFALVVSHAPLPSYREWKRLHGPMPWAAGLPYRPGVVWRDDSGVLQPLAADDDRGTRGKGAKARDSGEPAATLASWLRGIPGVDAVALEAFSVEPASGP